MNTEIVINGTDFKGSAFSPDGRHRLALWRIWDNSKPSALVIGLNPSRPSANFNSPTVKNVMEMIYFNNFGGFFMMNCFTIITPDPKQLPGTDIFFDETYNIEEVAKKCGAVVFAWGNFPEAKARGEELIGLFPEAMAFRINGNGSPTHPLFLPRITKLVKFKQ